MWSTQYCRHCQAVHYVYTYLHKEWNVSPEVSIRYDITAPGLLSAVLVYHSSGTVAYKGNQTPERGRALLYTCIVYCGTFYRQAVQFPTIMDGMALINMMAYVVLLEYAIVCVR